MICPICKKEIVGEPAMSRIDGQSICDECGIMEALDDAKLTKDQKDDIMAAVRDAKKRFGIRI